MLSFKRDHPDADYRDVKRVANHHDRESPVLFSRDEDVYLADIDDVQRRQDEVVRGAFDGVLEGGETVVALGCGWGYNLGVLAAAYPETRFVGGEPTENGVALARELFADHDRVRVEPFDFFDDRWRLLEQVDGRVVLFTRGSLTALPTAEPVVSETLPEHLDRVTAGVHLEHVYELHPGETLLGLLRREYTRLRDYNTDLLSALEETPALDVTTVTYDVAGGNPLHPLSEVHWEPT
ncbi:hypothetical protein ACFQH6_06410 [Halobacteriaceae archaeon GCM10025711]